MEQDLNYADPTVNEMIDFFKTRVDNLEPMEENSFVVAAKQKTERASRSANKKTRTPVS